MVEEEINQLIFASIWNKVEEVQNLQREKRPPLTNLVCEGGGVKAIAYIGALQVLSENGLLQKIQRVAGTSAGGIVATLLAVGYSPNELSDILTNELDIDSIADRREKNDPTRIFEIAKQKIGASDLWALFKYKGLYKGDKFVKIMQGLIKRKIEEKIKKILHQKFKDEIDKIAIQCSIAEQDKQKTEHEIGKFINVKYQAFLRDYNITELETITFSQMEKLNKDFPQLQFKELYLTGTKISNASLRVFCAETDPHMPIVDAVRITMSFPLAFEPVLYQGEYYADGGIALNAPMNIFNQERFLTHGKNEDGVNPCTLGLLVDNEAEIKNRWGINAENHKPMDFKGFVKRVIKGCMGRFDVIKNQYQINALQIHDQGVKALEFKLSSDRSEQLILAGRQVMQAYADMYMGNDILYSHLPEYKDLFEKYYTKSPAELIHYLESEIWPLMCEIHTLVASWSKIDFASDLVEINKSLKQYAPELVAQQNELYLRLEQLQKSLEINENKHKKMLEKKEILEARKREFWQFLDKSSQEKDKSKILEAYAALTEVTHETDKLEEELKLNSNDVRKLIEECKQLKNTVNLPLFNLIKQKTIAEFFIDNNILEKLNKTEEVLHEHMDIMLEAIRGHGKKYPDPRLTDTQERGLFSLKEESKLPTVLSEDRVKVFSTASVDEVSELNYQYAKSLTSLIDRLKTYQHKDTVLVANESDVAYNYDRFKNGKKYGKHETAYSLISTAFKLGKPERFYSLKKEYRPPPIISHILIPQHDTLKNASINIKELIVAFEDSPLESTIFHYSEISKHSSRRKFYFDKVKTNLLRQIRAAIRQMLTEEWQPPDAKIQLTITGKHLAGQDAQYLLSAVINELNADPQDVELKHIERFNLVLVDPTRVSHQLAEETARKIQLLRQKKPGIKVNGNNIIHEKQVGNNIRRRKKYNLVGDSNILSHVSSADGLVAVDIRDKADEDIQYQYYVNGSKPIALKKELNKNYFLSSNPLLKRFYKHIDKLKTFGKYAVFKALPHAAKFLARIPVGFAKNFFNKLAGPIVAIARLARNRPIIKKPIPNWAMLLKNRENKIAASQELPLDPHSVLLKKATDLATNAHPQIRLQHRSQPPIENLVIAGGGARVNAALGALDQLEQRAILPKMKRLAGSSTGALVAGLLAVGYSANELIKVFSEELAPQNILDPHVDLLGIDKLFTVQGVEIGISHLIALFAKKGMFKGEKLTHIVQSLIKNKIELNLKTILFNSLSSEERALLNSMPPFMSPQERTNRIDAYLEGKLNDIKYKYGIDDFGQITFKQLDELSNVYPSLNIKELYLTGTSLSDASMKVFSKDDTPNLSIAKAMRISLSFPGGLVPVEHEGHYYVDGAISNNYPMEIFDKSKFQTYGLNEAGANPCTLGLIVDSEEEIAQRWGALTKKRDFDFRHLAESLWIGLRQRDQIMKKYDINTIQISDNVMGEKTQGTSPFNINLNKDQKQQLLANGRDAVDFYYHQYIHEELTPLYLPSYSSLEQKYFSKTVAELKRILEEEVQVLLNDINILLPKLEEEYQGLDKKEHVEQFDKILEQLKNTNVYLLQEKSVIIRALQLKGEISRETEQSSAAEKSVLLKSPSLSRGPSKREAVTRAEETTKPNRPVPGK